MLTYAYAVKVPQAQNIGNRLYSIRSNSVPKVFHETFNSPRQTLNLKFPARRNDSKPISTGGIHVWAQFGGLIGKKESSSCRSHAT